MTEQAEPSESQESKTPGAHSLATRSNRPLGRLGTVRRNWVALSRHQGRGIHRWRPSGDQG
jgi:hypothetical protein